MPPNLLSEVHPDRSPDHGTRNMPRIAHVGVTRVEAHNILAQPERSEEGRGDGDDEPKQDCACGKLRKRSSESQQGGGSGRQNNCALALDWSANFNTIASLSLGFGVWDGGRNKGANREDIEGNDSIDGPASAQGSVKCPRTATCALRKNKIEELVKI